MTLTRLPDNLPALLRAAGVKVVEIDGWRTRGRPGLFTPVGSLVHHTGSPDRIPNNITDDKQYAEWMAITGRADLPAPLSQLSTARDGTVFILAAGRCNHAGVARARGSVVAGDGNRLYIGNEIHNSGFEPFPAAQYRAVVLTHAVLHSKVLGTSVNALGAHKETSTTGKWDPTLDMTKLRKDVNAAMTAPQPELRKPNRVQRANALLADGLKDIREAGVLLDQVPERRTVVHRLADQIDELVRELDKTADRIPDK